MKLYMYPKKLLKEKEKGCVTFENPREWSQFVTTS
jgi:hypothetical protein